MCPGSDKPALLNAGAYSPVDAVRDAMAAYKQRCGLVTWVFVTIEKEPTLVVFVHGWKSSAKRPDKQLAAELSALAQKMRFVIRVM